jgi:hypothetical protein
MKANPVSFPRHYAPAVQREAVGRSACLTKKDSEEVEVGDRDSGGRQSGGLRSRGSFLGLYLGIDPFVLQKQTGHAARPRPRRVSWAARTVLFELAESLASGRK